MMPAPAYEVAVAPAWQGELLDAIDSWGFSLPEGALRKLALYLELLCEWNLSCNLVAKADEDELARRHLIDSLSVVPFVGAYVADVGSGAGLPGIPLAIVRPETEVVLIESRQRRVSFLRHAVMTIGLNNVRVRRERAEQSSARYPQLVSRAFGNIGRFLALCGQLCAPCGTILLMKGADARSQLEEIAPPFRLKIIHPLEAPGIRDRSLVVLERVAEAGANHLNRRSNPNQEKDA